MRFNLKGLFKKNRRNEKVEIVSLGELTTKLTPYQIEYLLKEVKKQAGEFYSNKEIQRLKRIQNRTKKQRTKNKLQKRIDSYEK